MRRVTAVALGAAATSLLLIPLFSEWQTRATAQSTTPTPGSGMQSPDTTGLQSPGTDGGKMISFTPTRLQWRTGPPALPTGARMVILDGDTAGSGPLTFRLRLPNGYRIPPHYHLVAENITVISGQLRTGMGDTFSTTGLTSLPAGSFATMPAGMRHYAIARGVTEVQFSQVGPFGIYYVNAADDPRRSSR